MLHYSLFTILENKIIIYYECELCMNKEKVRSVVLSSGILHQRIYTSNRNALDVLICLNAQREFKYDD